MNGKRKDPTQDTLDFLLRHDFIWVNGWNFTNNGRVFDLSAADIFQIERIKNEGLFIVIKDENNG